MNDSSKRHSQLLSLIFILKSLRLFNLYKNELLSLIIAVSIPDNTRARKSTQGGQRCRSWIPI